MLWVSCYTDNLFQVSLDINFSPAPLGTETGTYTVSRKGLGLIIIALMLTISVHDILLKYKQTKSRDLQ